MCIEKRRCSLARCAIVAVYGWPRATERAPLTGHMAKPVQFHGLVFLREFSSANARGLHAAAAR
jgi:hypothetical protein